jgi:hypothetical protein
MIYFPLGIPEDYIRPYSPVGVHSHADSEHVHVYKGLHVPGANRYYLRSTDYSMNLRMPDLTTSRLLDGA